MSFQQLVSLNKEHAEVQSVWYRQLLTLAAGGFALLAGLGPTVPSGIGKYFLAGTWVFLGVGIISGAGATYLQVSRAKKLAENFQEELRHNIQTHGEPTVNTIVVANPSKIFLLSKTLMVVSLLLAVCCLVVYSVLNSLNA